MTDPFERVRDLLREILPHNRFWQARYRDLGDLPLSIRDADDFARLPFVTKADLLEDQRIDPPYGSIPTYPLAAYSRLHQTSGTTTGQPMRWLDTPKSWDWFCETWARFWPLAGVVPGDRFFFPFSFGPFFGFWCGFDGAVRAGHLSLAGGGMSSSARVRLIVDHRPTVLCATPSYALHLGEAARKEGIDPADTSIRAVLLAGEPGGSIPSTRARIESMWGARAIDHYGMTEVGPVAIEPHDRPMSLSVCPDRYISETIEPDGVRPSAVGEIGELVLTPLGREGSPLFRYRTGDLVRRGPDDERGWPNFPGGILSRTDDMILIRGNNVYPSSIEAIVRRFPEVVEFRLEVDRTRPLTQLSIVLEPSHPSDSLAEAVSEAIRRELLFRADVRLVEPGTLPRFELKAKRLVRID